MAPAAVAGVEMHLLFLSLLEAFLGQVLGRFGDQFAILVKIGCARRILKNNLLVWLWRSSVGARHASPSSYWISYPEQMLSSTGRGMPRPYTLLPWLARGTGTKGDYAG